MDSDLAESVSALKEIFQRRKLPFEFGTADPALVDDLRKKLRIPSRFRAFLLEANHTISFTAILMVYCFWHKPQSTMPIRQRLARWQKRERRAKP